LNRRALAAKRALRLATCVLLLASAPGDQGLGGSEEVGARESVTRAGTSLEPLAFSESPNRFFEAVAREAPRGSYPRSLIGEQSYWTVVGVDGGLRKALLDEDGRLEVATERFSLEPFLHSDGELVGWAEVEATQELADGYLPIPSVSWRHGPLRLRITAFAAGRSGSETLYARYQVANGGAQPRTASLFLAIRPFQVNPPWQSLNLVGGVAPIRSISRSGRSVTVDSERVVVALTPPDAFGAVAFESGSLTELLGSGRLPDAATVSDPHGYASGAFRWDLELGAGDLREVWVAVPLEPAAESAELRAQDAASGAARLEETTRFWRERLARIRIRLPGAGARLVQILQTAVGHILVNRSGPAIQPGPRNYARSWIRDGALISAALLEMGYPDEVRDFLRWYARYQEGDGRIPCCVDARGPDPAPEHDSDGEFIYAIASYYRHSGDRAFLEEMWPRVVKAVAHIRFLREQTMTRELEGPEALPVYGLAPESISHEGYASRPVHSYWDDFFLLRGLKDAVAIARELGDQDQAESFTALRDGFQADLHASISRAIERHGIDFIPGSVELGDFDPTSTSIAVSPGGELESLPRGALERTFERYFSYFLERRSGEIEWQSYTPYELRNVATLIRLGRKRPALEALDFFVADLRPPGWNGWAEVVWRDPRKPGFIGDMPHTWVGAGFVLSLRSLFVYEREADRALVIGAGIPRSWVDAPPGLVVDRLSTAHGSIGYSARREGDGRVRISLHGELRDPPDRIVIESPYEEPLAGVTVDGAEVADFEPKRVSIRELPAEVVLRY